MSELKDMTLEQVHSAGFTTAVLPLGATEPHNHHLPYGTDNYIAGHVAAQATLHANSLGGRCVCLPTLPFGYDGNMRDFPLAINLQPTTMIRIVHDIALSLVDSGLDYLFIVNGHGGNELKSIIRELSREVDLFICGANWWECVKDIHERVCPAPGDHANELETAACLHIVPHLVHMDRAMEGHMNKPVIAGFSEGWVRYSRQWKAFAPSSGAGDPRDATADAGMKVTEMSATRMGEFLHELSTARRHGGFPFSPEPDQPAAGA